MAQTATTGNLESAQKIIISTARYTEEHNAPALALIEQFRLPKGAKQVTVPKVATMTMSDLTDGQDMLSTAITIDASEKDSSTAAIPSVTGSYTGVSTADVIRIDVDVVATNTLGLEVRMVFST